MILSDTRDVVFQDDPFKRDLCLSTLTCGEEPIRVGQCPFNREWYRDLYGNAALEAIAETPVLCSGLTMGPAELVIQYLSEMCTAIRALSTKIAWRNGLDQAVHNHILRLTNLRSRLNAETADGSTIATMGYASPESYSIQSNTLVNRDGIRIAAVHQYDRHREYANWVMQRYN